MSNATVWTETRVVGDGGKIELVVPDFQAGDLVQVSVRRSDSPHAGQRPLGLLRGKIVMADGFDAPLDEFDPYTT